MLEYFKDLYEKHSHVHGLFEIKLSTEPSKDAHGIFDGYFNLNPYRSNFSSYTSVIFAKLVSEAKFVTFFH